MIACGQCGRQPDARIDARIDADSAPLGWMLEVDPRRGRTYVCDACARRHVRAIEGKLDLSWW